MYNYTIKQYIKLHMLSIIVIKILKFKQNTNNLINKYKIKLKN